MSDIVRHSGSGGMSIIDAAKLMDEANMLPQNTTWQQAAWVIQTGQEYGFGPAVSMRLFYAYKNQVATKADGMVALVMMRHPDWRFDYKFDQDAAVVKVYDEQDRVRADVTFTMGDAIAAGLPGRNANYKAYPGWMLLARAKAMAARLAAPDAVGGLYTAEELGAEVDRSGTPKQVQTTITSFEPDPEDEGGDITQAVYRDPDPEDEIGPKPGAVFRGTGSPGDKPLSTDAIDLLKDAMAAAGVQVKAFKDWTDKEGINRERLTVKDGARALCWVVANTAQGGDPTPAIDLHVQLTGLDPVIEAEEQ